MQNNSVLADADNKSLDIKNSVIGNTEKLVPLSFKVPKEFKKRYQRAAIDSELKLNELLAAMLDLWEEEKQ